MESTGTWTKCTNPQPPFTVDEQGFNIIIRKGGFFSWDITVPLNVVPVEAIQTIVTASGKPHESLAILYNVNGSIYLGDLFESKITGPLGRCLDLGKDLCSEAASSKQESKKLFHDGSRLFTKYRFSGERWNIVG